MSSLIGKVSDNSNAAKPWERFSNQQKNQPSQYNAMNQIASMVNNNRVTSMMPTGNSSFAGYEQYQGNEAFQPRANESAFSFFGADSRDVNDRLYNYTEGNMPDVGTPEYTQTLESMMKEDEFNKMTQPDYMGMVGMGADMLSGVSQFLSYKNQSKLNDTKMLALQENIANSQYNRAAHSNFVNTTANRFA